MASCTYYSDLVQVFYLVSAVYRQSVVTDGVDNYSITDIVPAQIAKNVDTTKKGGCSLPLTPRLITITDLVNSEWQFTIPFKPYSETWYTFLDELRDNPAIKAYVIRGEIVKFDRLNQLV